jgi:hypothetical protein
MFADIRDTLSFSADLLRDVTAQHIYNANVDGRPQGSGKYQKRGRAASGAQDGGELKSYIRTCPSASCTWRSEDAARLLMPSSAQGEDARVHFLVVQGAGHWERSVQPRALWLAASGLLK